MKKLMIAFAAIVCAVVTNAATVSWTITGVQDAEGTKLTSGHTYMFFAESASAAQTQIDAIVNLAGSGADAFQTAMSSANWNDTKKATAAGTFSIGTTAALGKYTLPTNGDLGLQGNTEYNVYAVIFDTETITDDSKYIVTAVKSVTTLDDTASTNKAILFGSQSSASWNAVAAVPEPTSGLMLLLGMAGLALRRRRA